MDSLAQKLYEVYFDAAAGGTPDWDALTDGEKAGWQAVADSVSKRWPFRYGVSDRLQDRYDVHGVVRSLSFDDHGRAGYWLQCLDSAGRPFDYYVEQCDVTNG